MFGLKLTMIKYRLFAFLLLYCFVFGFNYWNQDAFAQSALNLPESKEKVNLLNNEVDRLMRYPSKKNCKESEKLALLAAEISKKLNYTIGLLHSYTHLATIYKTLDLKIKHLKYKRKISALDPSGELKKQEDKLHAQLLQNETIKKEIESLLQNHNENLALIESKQRDLTMNEEALKSAINQFQMLKIETERLANRNSILEKDLKINELNETRQNLIKYFMLTVLIILSILAFILYKLYKSRHKNALDLAEKNEVISKEKNRSENLLLNILPYETAEELKQTGKAQTKHYDMVTVMFTDFKDFTKIAERMTPIELVDEIDFCYSAFDNIMEKYGIEKIKTIGDAYLCALGIAHASSSHKHNPSAMIEAAFDIIAFIEERKSNRLEEGKPFFEIRIGIHTGPLVAGVVGQKKFAYDIWGDTVNTAARIEQNSETGKINISADTYEFVKDKYQTTSRGNIEAKNKGLVKMYFLTRDSA